MNGRNLLVRTPRPMPTESLYGYLVRLTEANGYRIPRRILLLADMPRKLMMQPGMLTENLATILGGHSQELARISHAVPGKPGQFQVLGHSIGTRCATTLRLDEPAFCPECVEESRYLDAFWDLRAAIACPKHCRPVLRKCPACEKPVTWRRSGLLSCCCGSTLRPITVPPLLEGVRELMGILQAKLHRQPLSVQSNGSRYPISIMDEMELAPLLKVLEVLGTHHARADGVGEFAEDIVYAAAVGPLSNWPKGFHDFLKKLDEAAMRAGWDARLSRNPVKRLYGALLGHDPGVADAAAAFRQEFIRFGKGAWGYASKARSTKNKRPEIADLNMKAGSARQARISVAALGSSKTAIRNIAAALGLPVSVVRILQDSGELPFPDTSKNAWHEAVNDVLLKGARLVQDDREGCATKPLGDLMHLRFVHRTAKADIVRAVLRGQLRVLGRSGPTLAGLLLDAVGAEAAVREKRRACRANSYGIRDAVAITGIDEGAVLNAVSLGLLNIVESMGRSRITAASAEHFRATYVPLAKIADSVGSSSAAAVRVCAQSGIEVVPISRRAGQSAQPFVRREVEVRVAEALRVDCEKRKFRMIQSRIDSYFNSLKAYLEDLRSTNQRLPRQGDYPNKVEIARRCNFGRHVFAAHQGVGRLLSEYDNWERSVYGLSFDPVEKLKQYLDSLREKGIPLPRWGRGPNKKALSEACEFERDKFYSNPELDKLVHSYYG